MTTHGMARTPEYVAWNNMRQRCYNPKHPDYPNYGGRGITVCKRWKTFANFYADMGLRPSPEHSIDREENDQNYEPGNCRWVTLDVQLNNQRRTVIYQFNGKTVTRSQLCRETGITVGTLCSRLKSGLTIEQAVALGIRDKDKTMYTFNGETKNIKEWADACGVNYKTLYYRLVYAGKSIEEALK